MADYTSKYTGAQIDNAIAQSSKIPTIENNVGALQTGKQDKLSDEQLNNIADIPNKADSTDIPSELPNPFDLIINGVFYNGTKEVEINVENNGTGGTPNAVQYTPQTLTEEQITQALANLNLGLAPVDMSTVPDDYQRYTFVGESPYKGDFLICPRFYTAAGGAPYMSIINYKGELLKYKRAEDLVYRFRKRYNSRGEIRYTYLEGLPDIPTHNNVGFYHNCKYVVMDKDFNILDTSLMKRDKYLAEDTPIDSHQCIFIDDGHYVYACYYYDETSGRIENCIQEIRSNKLVFTWHTKDYPELFEISHTDTNDSGDYSHINSVVFDFDGHFIVSLRNIGIIKINRANGKVMWVIGKNRNDFTGIPTRMLPFQQHDLKFVPKDGSYTMFDNAGHETNSRTLKYSLDITTMTAIAEEFVSTEIISGSMGSSTLLDLDSLIFDVNYGGGFEGFEEYDFKNNKQLVSFQFEGGYDMYDIFRETSIYYGGVVFPEIPSDSSYTPPVTPPTDGVDKTALQAEISTVEALTDSDYTSASWSALQTKLTEAKAVEADTEATQEEVNTATSALAQARLDLVLAPEIPSDLPTPVYTLSEKIFDGTEYIDTGYKLFDTNKDWSITARYFMDSASTSGTDATSTFNCWVEWGVEEKGLHCGSQYGTESFKMNGNLATLLSALDRGKDAIHTFVYDASTNKVKITTRYTDGSIVVNPDTVVNKEVAFIYNTNGLYIDKNLIIGALQMDEAGTMNRYYKGTVKHFQIYDKALSDSELATIVEIMKS